MRRPAWTSSSRTSFSSCSPWSPAACSLWPLLRRGAGGPWVSTLRSDAADQPQRCARRRPARRGGLREGPHPRREEHAARRPRAARGRAGQAQGQAADRALRRRQPRRRRRGDAAQARASTACTISPAATPPGCRPACRSKNETGRHAARADVLHRRLPLLPGRRPAARAQGREATSSACASTWNPRGAPKCSKRAAAARCRRSGSAAGTSAAATNCTTWRIPDNSTNY